MHLLKGTCSWRRKKQDLTASPRALSSAAGCAQVIGRMRNKSGHCAGPAMCLFAPPCFSPSGLSSATGTGQPCALCIRGWSQQGPDA
jgi:hypothetical protein